MQAIRGLSRRSLSLAVLLVAGVGVLSGSTTISAQAVVIHLPGFAVVNQLDVPAGIPEAFGDILFSIDGSSILIIGDSEEETSGVWSAPVVRDASGTVLGFGAASLLFSYPLMDTSLGYLPGTDTLFFSVCCEGDDGRGQALGQRRSDGSIVTFPIVAAGSTCCTGIGFAPDSLPNAGDMLAGIYFASFIDRYSMIDNLDGTFTPVFEELYALLPSAGCSPGDLEFVPTGPFADDVIFTDFCGSSFPGNGEVWILDVDSTSGLPAGGATTPSNTLFASGFLLPHRPWGLEFDPITGNLFVVGWDREPLDAITQISGFPPLLPPTPEEVIAALIEDVDEFLAEGMVEGGAAAALDATLDTALLLLTDTNSRNDIGAMNALLAFVNLTQGLIDRGEIDPTDGQSLIDAAIAVVDEILAGG